MTKEVTNKKLTSELFKMFTESVLNEHKHNKYLHDSCIDIYSKTALFDFSNIQQSELNFRQAVMLYSKDKKYVLDDFQAGIIGESMFIKINETTSLFIRDYNFNTITGCYIKELDNNFLKLPITIRIDLLANKTTIYINDINKQLEYQIEKYNNIFMNLFCDIENTLNIINTFNNRVVLYDEPLENKATYYRYRDKTKGSLKVNKKPIYIILNKEKHVKQSNFNGINKQGNIKYHFSFLVVGHWRRLSDNSKIGKDKHGNYNIQGFTWVKSFIKGDKELDLVKKERILL